MRKENENGILYVQRVIKINIKETWKNTWKEIWKENSVLEKRDEKRRIHVCYLQTAFHIGEHARRFQSEKRHEKRPMSIKRDMKRDVYMCVTCKRRFKKAKTRGASKTKRDMKRGLYMWKETWKETYTCVLPAKGVSKRRRREALWGPFSLP